MSEQTYTFESTYRATSNSCPGVVFVLRRMTENRSIDLVELLIAYKKKVRMLLMEAAQLEAQQAGSSSEADKAVLVADIQVLQDQMTVLEKKDLIPSYLKWAVAGVENLRLGDGTQGSVDNSRDWPSELQREAYDLVRASITVTETERGNSSPATTSGEVKQPVPVSTNVSPVSGTVVS